MIWLSRYHLQHAHIRPLQQTWLQGSQTTYMAAQGSQHEYSSEQGRSCIAFYDLASEVVYSTVSVEAVTSQPRSNWKDTQALSPDESSVKKSAAMF